MDVQELFKNLRKEAECPLCLETVKDPKTLPCLHSFCLPCLDKHAGYARRQLQTTIKCPVCLACFQIPEGDTFGGLPTSFHLNRLVDLLALRDGSAEAQICSSCEENNTATCYCFVCQNFLCTACFEAHQRLKATRGHRNISVQNLQAQDVEELIRRPVMCSQQYHDDQPLEYYCQDCNVCICHKCSVVSHNRHTMVDIQKAAEEQKMQIAEALKKVKAEVVIYENLLKQETELMDKNKSVIFAAQQKMNETVDDCIRFLTEHKAIMNAKFDEISQAQQKPHVTRLDNLQLAVTQLKTSLEQGENILERNINAEILQTKQGITGRCEELLKATKPEIHKPPRVYFVVEQHNTEFPLDDAGHAVFGQATAGQVFCGYIVESHTDPSLSLAMCEKETEQKTVTNFAIITRDSDGKQCYNEDDHIQVNIKTPTEGNLETDIKDKTNGWYTVTYTPDCVGIHQVTIKINGVPLIGSPWSVQVVPQRYQFSFEFGSSGKGPGQFDSPADITVSEKTGTIAVTDFENNRIQLFQSNGNYLREIELKNKCRSLAFTRSGDLIALTMDDDDDNHKISMYSETGQFIKHINDNHKHLKFPMYIAVGSHDEIIACDWHQNEIKVISPDGTRLLQSFLSSENDESLRCVIYHQDRFFVSDGNAHCIKVFNKEGMLLYRIGSEGSGDGQLLEPGGLAIDKFNNLIVCDSGNERLQLFTLDGKFVSKMEQNFTEDNTPLFVSVSKNGDLFVADHDEDCVHVFKNMRPLC